MDARRWLTTVVGLIVGLSAAAVGFNLYMDPYGLYRDTRGRKILIYGDDRVAKYLLSIHYVPENFNSILLGSSVTANWEMGGVRKLRIYNESLLAANVVEERAIAREALSGPAISSVLLLVHPFFTLSHSFTTVKLEPSLRLSALGSQNLLEAYKDRTRKFLHGQTNRITETGTLLSDATPRLNPTLIQLFRPGLTFEVDALAVSAYQDLVRELHARRIQIIFIVPPLFEDLYQSKRAAFEEYSKLIGANMLPGDLMIDFTSEEFAAFRKDPSNFADGVHALPKAATVIVSLINNRINNWIDAGMLHSSAF